MGTERVTNTWARKTKCLCWPTTSLITNHQETITGITVINPGILYTVLSSIRR